MENDKLEQKKPFNKKDFFQLVVELFVIAVIFTSNYLYVEKQEQLYETSSMLADLEYLSAATQRLAKLASDHEDTSSLFGYLDVEHVRLLEGESNNRDEDTQRLINSWLAMKDWVESTENDKEMLKLISDNHYFIVSSFSSRLLILEDVLAEELLEIKWLTHFTTVILVILLGYRFKKNKIENVRNKAMREIALVDQATGLFNRSRCQELFQTKPRHNKLTGMIVIDLNDLKKINDKQGHRMGDAMIRSFALALRTCGEHSGTSPFLGRYGGDEFVVSFEMVENPAEVTNFLVHLREIVKEFNQNEKEFTIRYAEGYAISEMGESWTYQSLFDRADQNMYENKERMKHGEVREKVTFVGEETETMDRDTTFSIERNASISHRKNAKVTGSLLVATGLVITGLVFFQLNSLEYVEGNVLNLPLVGSYEAEHDGIGLSNPWKNSSLTNMLLYRGLLLLDSDLIEIKPDIATGYQLSEDSLTYTLTLEKGLKWSDGVDLTVEDVLFSIETFVRLEDVNFYVKEGFSDIVGYEEFVNGFADEISGIVTTDQSISFTLKNQNGNFPSCLAQFVPLPKHKLGDYIENAVNLSEKTGLPLVIDDVQLFIDPVTSGMYQLEYEDGEVVLVPNLFYGKETSDIKKIALLRDYNHLDIDFYTTNDLERMVFYRAIRGFTEYPIDQYTYRYIVYNLEGEAGSEEANPMTNIDVRIALVQALDREELLSSVYYDAGALVASGVIDKENGNAVITDYDPQSALERLEHAGYDFSRPIRIMYYHEGDKTQELLAKMVNYYEDIGLTVELTYSDSPEVVFDVRPYDILLKGLSAFDYFDWYAELGSDSELMNKILATEEYDPLIQALRECNSEEERLAIVEEMVALTMICYYKVPIFTLNQSAYVNMNRVKVPDDMEFANTLYRYDIRFEEWFIKKSSGGD